MVRLFAGVIVLLVLAGCGGHGQTKATPSAVAPRSVAEVERVFLRHGIRLSREGTFGLNVGTTLHLRYTLLLGSSRGTLVKVEVHRTVEPKAYVTLLTPKGQKPHAVFARNVFAAWGGPDLPAVREAIKALK